ncbi:type II secretion system protein GspK [Acuticoccus yangtzensis]|uniref:type II secretion system protein GspK n=1 Tax=Acuticoccus yangtzensis TaxID=1443441 RepID=UPI000A49D115|nr:type II secretion system protein GspK [Acuticoccus yangtzensis]
MTPPRAARLDAAPSRATRPRAAPSHAARPHATCPPGRGDAGFVLVAVLVVLALMAGIVAAASLAARGAAGSVRLGADILAADAMADAAVNLAAFQLYGLNLGLAEVNGQRIVFDNGTASITAIPEAARIDLNAAAPEVLAALWRGLSLGGSGEAFAAAIEARRQQAAASASDAAPRPPAVQNVAALGSLGGVGPDALAALDPYVTVFNPGGGVDLLTAPRAVLATLPGASPAAIDAVIARRADARDAAELGALLPAAGDQAATGRAHRLTVTVEHPALAPRRTEVVIARGARPGALYHVLAWRWLAGP